MARPPADHLRRLARSAGLRPARLRRGQPTIDGPSSYGPSRAELVHEIERLRAAGWQDREIIARPPDTMPVDGWLS
jgi:hypothetical protein